ncbi:MAG: hypothetical protein JW720_14065 [Sedimentisphaerales bacterium]|nr:hypothetical protein [Sedimentisphaerales bacterium]
MRKVSRKCGFLLVAGWEELAVVLTRPSKTEGRENMHKNRFRSAAGVTLAEAMISVVAVAVVALGGLSYEYHAAKHSAIARAQTTATRTVQLLLEDWKSTGGSTEYDPSTLGLGFTPVTLPSDAAASAEAGTTLNSTAYAIEVDNTPMIMALKYNDIPTSDPDDVVRLRQLVVVVTFGKVKDATMRATTWLGGIRPVVLTTYVRADGSGG